jgi:hypothetical protein
MQITFRGSPELLKIDEIGESILWADDSLRRQVINVVLYAIRNGGIPLRTKNGIKAFPDGLESVKRHARLTAKHKAEERAQKPSLIDLNMKYLHAEKERYIKSESHMQGIARGLKIPMYDVQILGLAHKQEYLSELECEMQNLDERSEQDKILRNQFVRLSELADWLRQEQGFDVAIVESSFAGHGEIAQMLAKWFDRPIGDLPPRLREIAEAYVPGWPELTTADRRARADEADRRLQAVLGARFAQANNEKEQAKNDPKQVAEGLVAWYDVTLDAMTWWGLGSVTPREAAMLLCQFNPHDSKLDPLSIESDEAVPADFKRLLRVFEDVAQNQSEARTLSDWLDVARSKRLKYHSWIDAFRHAVTNAALLPAVAPSGTSNEGETTAAPLSANWIEDARRIAKEYIDQHKKEDLFPSQNDVCSHVEKITRKRKIYSDYGKPLAAGYILRNAIQGKWWQANKP